MVDTDDTHSDTMNAFEAFGQKFLSQFGPVTPRNPKRKRDPLETEAKPKKKKRKQDSESEEEWTGITKEDSEHEHAELGREQLGSEEEDDGFTAQSNEPTVIHFVPQQFTTKSEREIAKSFMSSKVSKMIGDKQLSSKTTPSKGPEDDEDSKHNDRTLFKLIHTKLLTSTSSTDIPAAQRKKTFEGRVWEVAGAAKLGKGETAVRTAEHNKAPKRIRQGIQDKQAERDKKKLEEAKELGNYHHSIKHLFSESSSKSNKRERGMKMGVGSFRGGVLNLRKEEIRSIQGPATGTFKKKGRR